MKLATLLAITENLTNSFKKNIADYVSTFKNNQGWFKGENKTFTVNPGMQDLPNERGEKLVQFTVEEQLDWIENTHSNYIDSLFSLEATNASGLVKAELVVEGKSLGMYSSLELLRLKSILDSGEVTKMYETIPVRDSSEIWINTTVDNYQKRSIFENKLLEFERYTSTNDSRILLDPNVDKDSPSYKPVVVEFKTNQVIGKGTYQKYSGEWTLLQRAELLRRKTVLGTAIKQALEVANQAEAISSEMTAKKLFNYLHKGSLQEAL